jgi:hypothetical protein
MLFSFFFHFVYISKTIFCPCYITSKQQTRETTTFHQHAKVGTAGATVLCLPRSLACCFLYAHAHNSQAQRRWNCEAHSSIQRFLYFSHKRWGWLLTLSLRIIYCTSIKKELKKKGLIILNVINNIKWK